MLFCFNLASVGWVHGISQKNTIDFSRRHRIRTTSNFLRYNTQSAPIQLQIHTRHKMPTKGAHSFVSFSLFYFQLSFAAFPFCVVWLSICVNIVKGKLTVILFIHLFRYLFEYFFFGPFRELFSSKKNL